MDSASNALVNDDSVEDQFDRYAAMYQPAEQMQDLAELHALFRQSKSIEANRKRLKRPSWATVGRRTSHVIHKRPSWAPIG